MNYFFIILLFLFPSILLAGTESDLVLPTNNETILSSNQEIDDCKKNLKYPLTRTQENALKSLFNTLIDKKLNIKTSFNNLFKILKQENFFSFCENANHFFQNINEKIKDTGTFTSMITRQKHINDFILRDKDEISCLASHDLLQIFSNMYNGKGLPTQEDVQYILSLSQFKMDDKVDFHLLKSFSIYNHSKGCPSKSDIENFFNKDERSDKNPTVESIKKSLNYELNQDEENVLESLFETLNKKKINIKSSFIDLLNIIKQKKFIVFCTKINHFFQNINGEIKNTGFLTKMLRKQKHINDFILRDKEEIIYLASLDSLKIFSTMYSGKGLPTKKNVQDILDWQEWKTEYGEFNKDLFKYCSTMYDGKGLPTKEDVQYIISLSQFKKDDKVNLPLFKSFSTFHKSKKRPSTSDIERFFKKNKKLNSNPTFKSITNDLIYELNSTQKDALKSLFKTLNKKKINIKSSFSNPFKILKQEKFSSFCENTNHFFQNINEEIKDTGFFTSMLRTQKHINNFILRDKDEIAYLASCDLLQSFSPMYSGKGFPAQKDVQEILSWVNIKNSDSLVLIKLMSKLFYGNGFPDYDKLKEKEEILLNLFFKKKLSYKITEKTMMQLKIIILCLITNKPQYYIQLSSLEKFHKESKLNSLTQINQLTTLLSFYGGTITEGYINLNSSDQEKLMNYAKNKKPHNMIQKEFSDLMKFIDAERQKSVLLLTQDSTVNIDPYFEDSTQQKTHFDSKIMELYYDNDLEEIFNDAFNLDHLFNLDVLD